MKKYFSPISIVLAGLLAVNVFLLLATDSTDYYQAVTQTEPAPVGMKYLEYCDGGESENLVAVDDQSCIAEAPGEFARGAILFLSFVFFILFTVFYSLIYWLRKRT